MTRFASTLSKWKRSDYTGPNRCLPCTVVNVILAAGGALVSAALIAATGIPWGPLVGGLVFGVSLVLIYFNGYLVPGTPELTKRYLPRWLLAAFGKDDAPRFGGPFDPDAELRAAGIVIDGPADLELLPAFERAWRTAIDDIGAGDMSIGSEIAQRIAALGGFDIENLEFVERGNAFRVWYDEELIATWESRAACLADVAAADVIDEYDDRWHARPLAMQAELLGALRLFLERCPVCHGSVTLSLDVVSSCCYDYDVVAMTCNGCNARLFEIETNGKLPDSDERTER